MTRNIFLSFALCFSFCLPAALGQTNFNRSIGLPIFPSYLSPQLAGGGFLVVGDTFYNGGIELVTMRIDTAGQTNGGWRITTTPALLDIKPYDITRLADGRAAVAGAGHLNQSQRGFVCILDSNGQGTTASQTNFEDGSIWYNIAATSDSGFVVGGTGTDFSNNAVSLVARYDKHLNLIWTRKLFLANQTLYLRPVAVLPGDACIVAGQLYAFTGASDLVLARLDASGNLTWAKSYQSPTPLALEFNAIHYDGQDRLYVSGNTSINLSTEYKMAIIAMDTTGAFIWANNVVDPDNRQTTAYNLLAGNGGALILSGGRQGTSFFSSGMTVAFSSAGSILWARTSKFGSGGENIADVALHPDGGYIWLMNESPRRRLLKTDSLGLMGLPCGPFPLSGVTVAPFSLTTAPISLLNSAGLTTIPLTITNTSTITSNYADCNTLGAERPLATFTVQVLPQPLRSSARITLSGGDLADDAQLHISDLSGRSIALPVTRIADGWEIQRGGLPAGIYAYQVLQDGQRIASGKLWVAD